MQSTIKNRTIFCRDNIEVMRGMDSNSVDLIYLDPPFNKNKMFCAPLGSYAEGASFKDYWGEEDVKDQEIKFLAGANYASYAFLTDVETMGRKGAKYYLLYMGIRLMEMHRILKPTGSIYLHCDPTMSHYLKVLMDSIFGEDNFKNEIVWWYKGTGAPKKSFSSKHDIIFFYTKTQDSYFNPIQIPAKKVSGWTGKNTKNCDSVWEINTVFQSQERKTTHGYPTQKPLKLLKRIIQASSQEGDIVLDPFCGCATSCVAAENLKRKWIGIDISDMPYKLVKERLNKQQEDKGAEFFKEEIHFCDAAPIRTDPVQTREFSTLQDRERVYK
ncbi:MAG: site-specific DNA-methyltransferase [Cytophagales bacterium]|nr:site-specific DNA-methyltransferase [Cytophagales bacterium]